MLLALPLVVHVAAAVPAAPTEAPPAAEPSPVPAPDPLPPIDRAWIDARVAEANRVFTPFGVTFAVQAVVPLAAKYADAAERTDRDALATLFSEGAIHVFVVARLMDIHEAGRPRQGVHWKVKRGGAGTPARFVIVAGYSSVGVLAHELGHFLGHASHTNSPDNLMSYLRTGLRPVTLTQAQGQAMARRAKALVRSGYVRAATPPGVAPQSPGSTPP